MMIIPLWKHKAENQLFLPWHSRTTDGHARKQMRSVVLLESSTSLEDTERESERERWRTRVRTCRKEGGKGRGGRATEEQRGIVK